MTRTCSVLGACAFPNCDCPLLPESETPRVDEYEFEVTQYDSIGRGLKCKVVQSYRARQLERELFLAQTEIKGHMRIEDDLKEELADERIAKQFFNAAYRDAQARIAVLEKDAARYWFIRNLLAIEDIERLISDGNPTPDEEESLRTDDAIDEALKDRA